MIILYKLYDGNSITDVEEDIIDALNYSSHIPEDEHGFKQGTFKVTVEYLEDE